jgi:hypothetical protein
MAGRSLLSRAAVCCIAAVAAALAGCAASPARPAGARTTAPALSRSAASPTATAAAAVPPLPAGQQGTQQQVPWAQVGPGWFLAEWLPTVTPTVPASLFLVDPAGGRYLIETLPANPSGSTPYQLVSWSGDGQRALLESVATPLAVAVLDLRTLATTELELGSGVGPIGFTKPDGLAIIAGASNGSVLERFSLTGQLELSYPTSFPGGGGTYQGSPLYTPDGTELAVATSTGIELISNDGQALRFLPVSPSVSSCSPLRWWTTGVLVASCAPDGSSTPQLWLVPTSGATPTALTANRPASGDMGDLDAWQLPGGTYVEDAGACGYEYAAKLGPDGLTAPVTMPGVLGGDTTIILGAQGDSLGIYAVPACHVGASLLWYAPATNSVTPLLGGVVNGGSVGDVIMFGQR